jgi:NADH dehydrogenase [ubiquinone] 1 alpha subcomplex assembly factor 7
MDPRLRGDDHKGYGDDHACHPLSWGWHEFALLPPLYFHYNTLNPMPIDSKIRAIIKKEGSVTIDTMMQEVLSANSASYYRKQNALGAEGDFITSPEISQLFGETIGLWATEQWERMGKPSKVNLVELGPGRGLLMDDLLRVAKLVPEFYDTLSLQLIEINPHFIKKQKSNLASFKGRIKWTESIEDIEPMPTILIANEFFDALPIKQYVKAKELWYENVLFMDPSDGKVKCEIKIYITSFCKIILMPMMGR